MTEYACKDLVIIHGMNSDAFAMRPLARALERRDVYRKIHRIDLPHASHILVPRAFAESNASELAQDLVRKIKRRSLTKRFDVIGHSNGGYVALYLGNYLERDTIDWTFTIATPKFGKTKLLDVEIPNSRRKKVIHFRGGVDFIPFSYFTNSGEGRLVCTFPDEGHCSLHLDANTNGLADFIALINDAKSSNAFADNKGTIHIWPHCREELGENRPITKIPSAMRECTICNGMHDLELETLKQNKVGWEHFLAGTDVALAGASATSPVAGAIAGARIALAGARYSLYRIKRFLRIRSILNNKIQASKDQIAAAQLHGDALSAEINSLRKQIDEQHRALVEVEQRLVCFFDAAQSRHKQRLQRALHPLAIAVAYVKAVQAIDDGAVREVVTLLESASDELDLYHQDMTSSSRLQVTG